MIQRQPSQLEHSSSTADVSSRNISAYKNSLRLIANKESETETLVLRKFGRPSLEWSCQLNIVFTQTELSRSRQSFVNSADDKLFEVLQKPQSDETDTLKLKLVGILLRRADYFSFNQRVPTCSSLQSEISSSSIILPILTL